MPLSFMILILFFLIGLPVFVIGLFKKSKSLIIAGTMVVLLSFAMAISVWMAISEM